MFRNLSQLAAANAVNAEAKKVMSPALRSDIYSAIDQTKSWLVGGVGGGQAGDGVSFGPIISTIQKHFPDTKLGLESIGQVESEVAVVVGGITNMVMEMSKWEGMAGGMAMRTWVDGLVEAHGRVGPGARKEMVAKGITRGVNQNTDVSLMTKEFTAKIQIISALKTSEFVHARVS
jgi:neutral ceramidase